MFERKDGIRIEMKILFLSLDCEVKIMNCVMHKNIVNIEIGKPVTSNNRVEQFNLTDGKQYLVTGFDGDCIKIKNDIDKEEWYFKGHFPDNPIMPGVLIAESLAQTGAVAILSMEENKGKNALFGGIDKMKFKKMVVPGDRLKLEVKIIKRKGPIGIGEGIATVDGKVAAKGEFTFAIV